MFESPTVPRQRLGQPPEKVLLRAVVGQPENHFSHLAPLLSLGGHDVLLSRLRRPKRSGFCRVPGGSGRRNQGRANASEAAVSSRVA